MTFGGARKPAQIDGKTTSHFVGVFGPMDDDGYTVELFASQAHLDIPRLTEISPPSLAFRLTGHDPYLCSIPGVLDY
jgi:hypothetical protein